jgi:hypothetical protein
LDISFSMGILHGIAELANTIVHVYFVIHVFKPVIMKDMKSHFIKLVQVAVVIAET